MVDQTCSSKAGPVTMRGQPSPRDKKRTLDEENTTYPTTDRPHAARGRGKADRRQLVPETARELGISEATFQRWRNHYGGMKADAMKRLKELESENARLKKIVADQAVDIDILKEVSRKNF